MTTCAKCGAEHTKSPPTCLSCGAPLGVAASKRNTAIGGVLAVIVIAATSSLWRSKPAPEPVAPETPSVAVPAPEPASVAAPAPQEAAAPAPEDRPAAVETREARSRFDEVAREGERNAQLAARLGSLVDAARQELAAQHYDAAIDAADRALSINPNSAAAMEIKNQALAHRGR